MFKRVMMIGLVAISVVLMLGTEAKAQTIWQVRFSQSKFSIDCASILNGLSKKASTSTLVACTVLVDEFTFRCVNKGGNSDTSNSDNFQPQDAMFSAFTVASQCTLDKVTGKWHCDQTISDAQLQTSLAPLVDTISCPSGSWTIDVGVVTEMDGKVSVYSCKDSTGKACSPGTPGCSCTQSPGTPGRHFLCPLLHLTKCCTRGRVSVRRTVTSTMPGPVATCPLCMRQHIRPVTANITAI
jgi:hypothetical protein